MPKKGGKNNNNNNNKKGNVGKGRNPRKLEAQHKRAVASARAGEGIDVKAEEGEVLIDGSFGEGGGQVLRNTFALASLLSKPIRIVNIRANRNPGGLRAQHLTGLLYVKDIYNGVLTGERVGATMVAFRSSAFNTKKKTFTAEIGTAGSICLLIQIALPCLIFAPVSSFSILKGGTNALHAPPIDYCLSVFHPMAERMGLDFKIEMKKRGFYPRGGGVVHLHVEPLKEPLKPITLLDKGIVNRVKIFSYVGGRVQVSVAERMVQIAKRGLRAFFPGTEGHEVEYETEIVEETAETAEGDGTGIMLIAYTTTGCIFAGSGLGERNKSSETVAQDAVDSLTRDLAYGGCVDEYLQDQLIIFMALAKGKSSYISGPLSLHTTTAIHFSTLMTGAQFTVTKVEEGKELYLVECEGIGLVPPSPSIADTTTTTTATDGDEEGKGKEKEEEKEKEKQEDDEGERMED